MKPQPQRNPETHPRDGSIPREHHSVRERGMHAANARPPPAVPYRRYPSLCDDGQPYFPRLRRKRRPADDNATVANPANESDRSPFFSVRAVAVLAIVAIITALVASA